MADAVLQKLIQDQAYNINTVSGATGTSNAVNNAINAALAKALNPANTTNTPTTSTPSTPTNNSPAPVNGVTSASGSPAPISAPPTLPVPTQVTDTGAVATSSGQYRDGTFTGNGIYAYHGGSSTYSVEITIVGGKITAAKWLAFLVSGNGLYTRDQADAVLQKLVQDQAYNVNTVSGATGTSNAITDAIRNALAKAKIENTISEKAPTELTVSQKQRIDDLVGTIFGRFEEKLPTDAFIAILRNAREKIQSRLSNANDKKRLAYSYILALIDQKIRESEVVSFTAPNGSIYAIHRLASGEYTFERPDKTFSDKKFANHALIMKYLVDNTLYKMEMEYKTPNGKKYIVLQNLRDKAYYFKRPDGTISTTPYTVKEVLLYNLLINNPLAPRVVVMKAPATIAKTITVKPIVKATQTVGSSVSVAPPVKLTPVAAKPVATAPVSAVTKAS